MSVFRKSSTWIGLFFALVIQMPAYSAMVETSDMRLQSERTAVISLLGREEVQQQLMELGVDQKAALERVNQMTYEEIVALNGQITELPAGAGVSTIDLLLIVLILVLLL